MKMKEIITIEPIIILPYKSRGLGQAEPEPSREWRLWPGLKFHKAKATSSQAKAAAFRPSRAVHSPKSESSSSNISKSLRRVEKWTKMLSSWSIMTYGDCILFNLCALFDSCRMLFCLKVRTFKAMFFMSLLMWIVEYHLHGSLFDKYIEEVINLAIPPTLEKLSFEDIVSRPCLNLMKLHWEVKLFLCQENVKIPPRSPEHVVFERTDIIREVPQSWFYQAQLRGMVHNLKGDKFECLTRGIWRSSAMS